MNNRVYYQEGGRPLDIEALTNRKEICPDDEKISAYFRGKRILITGGAGFIGSRLCRKVAAYHPKSLVIVDAWENGIYEMQHLLSPLSCMRTYLASVRDKKRLEEIFTEEKPQIVFHAAAHKHVPIMEENPEEAVKNNVLGTYYTALCADRFQTEKFILISTDKAVNPVSVMGATKRIGELLMQAMNPLSYTAFSAVRFGNVLGSSGSVLPLFERQIACAKPITVTDQEVTRFFMSPEEAAGLVLSCCGFADGGIFVLNMGQAVRIYDLAQKLIAQSGKQIPIELIGLRPGDKLCEELFYRDALATAMPYIFSEQPISVNLEVLTKQIQQLSYTPKDAIRQELQKIVPEYHEAKKGAT